MVPRNNDKPPVNNDMPSEDDIRNRLGSGDGTGSGQKIVIGVGKPTGRKNVTQRTFEEYTVDAAKDLIDSSLATGDNATFNQIIKAIGPGYTMNQYKAIWSRAVDWAAFGGTDPFNVLKTNNFKLGVLSGYKPGGSGRGYTPTASVRQYSPTEAKNTAVEAFRAYLQRNPTNQELAEFTKDLNAAAARNPTETITKIVGGKAVTTTKGGFDVGSWARGYISARYKNETDSLATRSREDLLNTAKAYGVNMGDAWYQRAGNQIMKGQDPEKYIDDIRKAAASRYTAFADRILAGDTLEQIASPYLQSYASTLELNPYDLDVMDPTIQQALLNTDDAGQNRPINLFEFERNLKKDPRWQQTRNAQQQYSGLATRILQDFGLLG